MAYSLLHNHSEYSVLDGFAHPEEYLIRAREIELTAFAITEHGNQYSWVYFSKLQPKYPDIKIIYGVELYETFDIAVKDPNNKYFHLVALAMNEQGRIALNDVITTSNFKGFYSKPRIDIEHLRPYASDLIILSACLASKLAREPDYKKCLDYVVQYRSVFPHFYLEIQSHDNEEQKQYNQKIIRLAHDTNTPYVITTDSHAATEDDLYFQARHVQIARDDETITETYNGCYLQSVEELHLILDKQIGHNAVEVGIETANHVAEMIETITMPFQSPQLPTYPLPDGFQSNIQYLRSLMAEGWCNRGLDRLSQDEQQVRRQRIEYELDVIEQMHYEGYFLIVWDFVNYAKHNDVLVGDGRGSGGGSMVNYLLGITELDPIEHNLIFERFLNPERVSMPDIDLDFSDRDRIISYLKDKYGEDRICQIINFSYITPIVAIKDVGRVLGIPYSECDKISKSFTYPSFRECMDNSPNLLAQHPDYGELFVIAEKISGRVRNASIHAGGVGIVDTKITDYMGMKVGSNGERVIQVDKRSIEDIGIIKFDILGLATLSIVKEVMDGVGLTPWDLNINNPSFANDTDMYELLCSARTNGVFQVESEGMKQLLSRLSPTTLDEVSAVLALYRPDTLAMLEDYIHFKHNPRMIEYWHPDIQPILRKTYGCIIYQEEIMDIVRVFGGRSYGGADKFRKGIGKKDKELVQQEAEILYGEIIENGYDMQLARLISDYMKTMGGYSFNKSHSDLYAILTLKTAYLKAHYPAEFFCALLNHNRDDYGTLNKYIVDAKEFGVEILPPHINHSQRGFAVQDGKILFGLEAIRGIGAKVSDDILRERETEPFHSFNDFVDRVSPTVHHVVCLVKAGAIPCRNKRKFLLWYAQSLYVHREFKPVKTLPTKRILLEKYGIDCEAVPERQQRLDMLNEAKRMGHVHRQLERKEKHIREFQEKYLSNEHLWEFEALSVFLTDNPFVKAYSFIKKTFHEVPEGGECVVVGVVANVLKKKDRNHKQYAILNVYSAFGIIEATCWNSQLKASIDLISRGQQIAFLCRKTNDGKAIIKAIKSYEQWLDDRNIRLDDNI